MAGTQQKRQREESREEEAEASRIEFDKRQYSYNNILSILDDEKEYDPNQDLSAIFTTLQQELSCSTTISNSTVTSAFDFDYLTSTTEEEALLEINYQHDQAAGGGDGDAKEDEEEEDDDRVRVIKHLLEASDDELGIPNRVDEEISSGENPPPFAFSDGLWEVEDETANYYTFAV